MPSGYHERPRVTMIFQCQRCKGVEARERCVDGDKPRICKKCQKEKKMARDRARIRAKLGCVKPRVYP